MIMIIINVVYLSLNLSESTNCGLYFLFSYWRRDGHFTLPGDPREGLAICKTRQYFHFTVTLEP